MWRRRLARLLLVILASSLAAPGCMTMKRERRQSVAVTSSPVGAAVAVNGVPKGVTPCALYLDSGEKVQVIRIESPGYDPVEIRPRRRLSGQVLIGNFVLGASFSAFASIGWTVFSSEDSTWRKARGAWLLGTAALTGLFTATDIVFKRGYQLRTRELAVTLKKAQGTRRVDTIYMDPAVLQSLKWIRAQRAE